MTNIGRYTFRFLVTVLTLIPSLSFAIPSQFNYCIVPPFIGENVPANLLLMIDNSSSMYDLTYADEGNTDETGTITRQPYYCYDESYASDHDYTGYFDNDANIYYTYDTTNKVFTRVNGSVTPFPSSASCTYYVANQLCVKADASGKVGTTGSTFAASGKYLNWLTASKFDVEKQILTGGKVVSKLCYTSGGVQTDVSCNSDTDCSTGQTCTSVTPSFVQAESRGCVGQGFIKTALTADFTNFASTSTDPNTKLGVSFMIRGPVDPVNPANPSRGGQTYIDVFFGTYDNQKCQQAVTDYYDPTASQSTVRTDIQSCINYNPSATNYCSGDPTHAHIATCTVDTDCSYLTGGHAGTCAAGSTVTSCYTSADCSTYVSVQGKCTNLNTSGGQISCSSNTNCVAGSINGGHCSNNNAVCANDSGCAVKTAGKCSLKKGSSYPACSSDANCYISGKSYGTCTNPAPVHYTCSGINPATTGTCTNPAPTMANYACSGATAPTNTNVGPCINPTTSGVVKTKIALTEAVQTCWTYLSKGQAIGTGDYSRLQSKCNDVYAAYGVCSDNNAYGCSTNTDCSNRVTGSTCQFKGPAGILEGNAAMVCSDKYVGAFCTGWNAVTKTCTWGGWTALPADPSVQKSFQDFCNANQPAVLDPTDSASNSTNYEQVPALLSGMGLEGQLGSPVGTIPVRVGYGTAPTGLIQQFGNRIRIGGMSFDFNGSKTEAAATGSSIVLPRVCVSDHTRVCTIDADCGGTSGSCLSPTDSAQYNLDGGRVIYPVGKGVCGVKTATTCTSTCATGTCVQGYCVTGSGSVCATNATCTTAGETCNFLGPGDHSSGLVNTIDILRANAWTPFAEAYYNAIGYFAPKLDGSGNVIPGYSRSDIRLNGTDFADNLNPSQYRCQQNFVLLVTDGSSTADRHASVATLAGQYATAATPPDGTPTNWNATCPYYAGSSYLPIMTWIGQNRNISDFTRAPVNGRDRITTYVVTSGGSNGQVGECNGVNLLADTAEAGGTTVSQANDPKELRDKLTEIFQQLAAKSASGTAASILSNSEGSGANILQAVFYPRKIFLNDTKSNWLGELQNLWYYVDPNIGNSTMREDTDGKDGNGYYNMKLSKDEVVNFYFDPIAGITKVNMYQDTDGNGTGDTPNAGRQGISPDEVKSLWRAGKQLWERDLVAQPRTMYTPCNAANGGDTNADGGTCVAGTGLMKFSWASPDNRAALKPYLQTDDATVLSTGNLMKYVHGYDFPQYTNADGTYQIRSRTVQSVSDSGTTLPGSKIMAYADMPSPPDADSVYVTNPMDRGLGVWKLGDIISSTPRLESSVRQNAYNLPKPAGYGDTTYGNDSASPKSGFIYTDAYANRGVVFAGANDGMLHAFKLGTLSVAASGDTKATLKDLDSSGEKATAPPYIGDELWAFMPKNVLPYLTYYADPSYGHLYYMDGNTTIVDASVGKTGCTETNYMDCTKTSSTWRTILIGGMGIGGASRPQTDTCTEGDTGTCVKTPIVDAAGKGVGYSAYYALDVTDPLNPKYLWEFSDAVLAEADRGLGFATSGAAIVKISATTTGADHLPHPDSSKNGRWFAVFVSGPTGPIDQSNNRFKGTSNQPLKVYVVDLAATLPFVNGTNYWVFNQVYDGGTSSTATVTSAGLASLSNAFGGSVFTGPIDADRWDSTSSGNYQDDAVYFGYTQKDEDAGTWTKGGVLKLVTKESTNPSDWKVVKVFDGIGPVTTNIARLQDRKSHSLWLYFGTGRYFYMQDDFNPGRTLYGIREPCYRDGLSKTPKDSLDPLCAVKRQADDVLDQTDADKTLTASSGGWLITLENKTGTGDNILGGERVITDPVALTNGAVFFTTYKPNNDFCQFGGSSYLWATKYDTGLQAPSAALVGKALVQVSTGEFKQIDLSTAFNDPNTHNRRMATGMTGKPPQDSPPIVSKSNNKPVKRIIHMQEQ